MNRDGWRQIRSSGDKAVVVLRDPRDRLISLLFSVRYSHGSGVFVDYLRAQLAQMKDDHERILRLIGDEGYFLRYYLTWLTDAADDAYVVRYEDLIRSQYAEFKKIIEWLGWGEVPEEVLAGVVERLSFTARTGRQPGDTDVSSHFRRGVGGDWRNHFTREHGRLWERLYPGFLTAIGYESSDDWWETLPDSQESPAFSSQSDLVEKIVKEKATLENELLKKETEIQILSKACDERLKLIHQLNEQINRHPHTSG